MDAQTDGKPGLKRRQEDTFVQKVRSDVIYRRKLILTVSVCWSYVILGWVICQIGTALPDLQLLARIDLDTASWLFTSWSIGYVIGSLASGFMYDAWNRIAIMMVSALGMTVCSVSLPYSGSFAGMIVVRLMTGVFCGGSDTGANTIVPSTWSTHHGGSFMQILYLSYTLGGIVSPFATRPFMSQKSSHHDTSGLEPDVLTSNFYNVTMKTSSAKYFNYSSDFNMSLTENGNYTLQGGDSEQHSQIHYAFIVTGAVTLTSFLPYLLMLVVGNFDQKDNDVDALSKEQSTILKKKEIPDENQNTKLMPSNGFIYAILICVAGINMTYGASEDSLADFLVTFCLDYLEWTNSSAVLIASLYWISSCVGGVVGIFIVQRFGNTRLLVIALLLWNASMLALVIASIFKIETLFWAFITISGLCMISIIPTVISWTNKNVCEISGKVSSLMMIATGIGISANPRFIGYMMEAYTYIYLFYILLAESIICSFLYLVSVLSLKYSIYKSNMKKELDMDMLDNETV